MVVEISGKTTTLFVVPLKWSVMDRESGHIFCTRMIVAWDSTTDGSVKIRAARHLRSTEIAKPDRLTPRFMHQHNGCPFGADDVGDIAGKSNIASHPTEIDALQFVALFRACLLADEKFHCPWLPRIGITVESCHHDLATREIDTISNAFLDVPRQKELAEPVDGVPTGGSIYPSAGAHSWTIAALIITSRN